MTPWLLFPFMGLIALVQTALVPLVPIGGYRIDLPLLVVVGWGLVGTPGEAALWGFAAGIFLDILSGLPFGTQTLALTTVGLVMGLMETTIFRSNVILPPISILIATLGYHTLTLAILYTLNWPIAWNDYLLRVTLPTAVLNTVSLPLAYFPLQWLYRLLTPIVEW